MPSAPAKAGDLASSWATAKPETKSRLVAGEAGGKPLAGIEITLAPGWKTYWKFPGDSGGIPPLFDWSASVNVKSVAVTLPVPLRMKDRTGDILGYSDATVFPVVVEPVDASKPIGLKLSMEYGVCREVCIPVDATHAVEIPATGRPAIPAALVGALDRVPRLADTRKPEDPKLLRTEVKLDGDKPWLAIEAEFPGGTDAADAYVVSPNGYYIPLPKPGSAKPIGANTLRFEIDLTGAVEPADIRGKSASVTLVSARGHSEAMFKFE
jgi:DsbC/DsbD-like thiol-disulfide interchange protein